MDETLVIQENARALKTVIDRVFFKRPKGYSVVFTEYFNPDREPGKNFGPVAEAYKDILIGKYSNGIGKDVIFETPTDIMDILRENIGKELPKMIVEEYDLSIPEGYLFLGWSVKNPVIVTKK